MPLHNWGKTDKFWIHNHDHLIAILKRHILFTFQNKKMPLHFQKCRHNNLHQNIRLLGHQHLVFDIFHFDWWAKHRHHKLNPDVFDDWEM